MLESIQGQAENQDVSSGKDHKKQRALIENGFLAIESILEDIKVRREDVAAIIDRLVAAGENKRAIKLALARRKLAADGKLEVVDRSLERICGVTSLGIQGELFAFAADERAA